MPWTRNEKCITWEGHEKNESWLKYEIKYSKNCINSKHVLDALCADANLMTQKKDGKIGGRDLENIINTGSMISIKKIYESKTFLCFLE